VTDLSHHDLVSLLALLAAGTAMLVLVPKLRIPYPILLVLGGLALGFVPGLPRSTCRPTSSSSASCRRSSTGPRSSPRSAICGRTFARSACSRSASSS
jgi:hypothetical protein